MLRFVALLLLSNAASLTLAQDVDDLFDDSDVKPPCECHHHIFSLDSPPKWIPQAVKSKLVAATKSDDDSWHGAVLFCPTTNAVIERFALKRAYRILVCPSEWQGFNPKKVGDKTLVKNGIPIEKIRAMFQSLVMGPLEVSFRARHSREMMGAANTHND